MSETSDRTSCISHKKSTRFFVIYDDYLTVAKVSEHQHKLAAFWRVLETKTNDWINNHADEVDALLKADKPLPKIWIEMNYNDFVNRCLGFYKASSFRIAAVESERLGFSESRVRIRPTKPTDPDSPVEEYKEYCLNIQVLQSVMNGGAYPTPVENNSPLLKKRVKKTPVENNSPSVENNKPPLLKTTKTPVENNIFNNIEESSKDVEEENALSSIDETRTLSSSSNSPSSLQETTASETPSQSLTEATQPLSNEQGPVPPPTPKIEAQREEKATGQGNEQSTKQEALLIVESDIGKTSSGKGNKGSQANNAAKKPTPGADEKALRKQVQKWIDEKRGYRLHGSATEKQIFAEQNAVSMFALKLLNEQQGNHEEGCTWEELDHLWKETRKDTYWGKPENIGRIGGYALQQQFTTIILGKYRKTKLKQMRDQNAAQGATQTGTNMASAVQEHRQMSELERRNAELRAKYGQKQIS